MTEYDLERALAYGVGVSSYTTCEYQTASFVKLARKLYQSQHERESFVTGYLAAAAIDHGVLLDEPEEDDNALVQK